MIPGVILGAGITGLACARLLAQAGVPTLCWTKGAGSAGGWRPAGRVQCSSTTARSFLLRKVRVLQKYCATLSPRAPPRRGRMGPSPCGRHPGMSSLAGALAAELDIRQGVQITAIRPTEAGWQV